MQKQLNSPLSGTVTRGFAGGGGGYKSKLLVGAALLAMVPIALTTFAASVTVGNGNLEFGQGSQQAIACDPPVFVAIGEEWKGNPSADDSSSGFFRVRTVTISNLNFESCAGKKLRVRLIDGNSQEITLGNIAGAKVLQVSLPATTPVSNVTDTVALGQTYLNSIGQVLAGAMAATSVLNISGTSVYDGSALSTQNGDVTFYIDSTATAVNIDGQSVRRATVETVASTNVAP